MAFNVGAIVGHLSLDKSKWSKSITSVKKDQKSLGSWVKKNSAQFKKMGMVIAGMGIAVATSFAVMLKKTAKAGDEIAKLSRKVGISTELLSGYKLAAEHGGASLASLGKGLGRLSRTIADADRGLVTYIRTFQDLNIDIKTSDGNLKSMEQVMLEVAERFSTMEAGTKKTSLAMEMFGRAGMDLIPMLDQGAEGLKKEYKEAERLGLIFSEKSARACEEFNDRLHDLNMSLSGVGKTMALELMPVITEVFNIMRDEIIGTQEQGKAFAQSTVKFFMAIAQGIQGLMLAWHAFKALAFKIASYITSTLAKQVLMLVNAFILLEKIPIIGKKITPITEAMISLLKDLVIITDGYNDSVEKEIENLSKIIEGFEKFKFAVTKAVDVVSTKAIPAVEKLDDEIIALQNEMGAKLPPLAFDIPKMSLEDFMKYQKESLERMKEEWKSSWESMMFWTQNILNQLSGILGQFYQNQLTRIDNQYEREKSAIENSTMNEQEKASAIERLDKTIEKKRKEALKKQFKMQQAISIVSSIVNTAEAVTKALASAFPPLNFVLAGIVGGLGAIQTALIAGQPVPSFAVGGVAMKETPAIVGERPEAIIPLEDLPKILARIAPATPIGGATFHNVFNISTIDALSFRDFIRGTGGDEIIQWLEIQGKSRFIEALGE